MEIDDLGAYAEFPHPHEIRIARILPAPVERVWAFLTDPEKRATWLAAGPLDPRCGGNVHLCFDHARLSPGEAPHELGENGRGTKEVEGRITGWDPPNLLCLTWGESEVSLELTRLGMETRLVLDHRRLSSTEETIRVAAGWHVHLAYLLARLTGQTPPPFWANHARLVDEYATRFAATLE